MISNENIFRPRFSLRHRMAIVLAAIFFLHAAAFAQKLPLTVYTSSDGLASSVIHHIEKDSDGFLWFAARGGLSRYDGNEFEILRFTDSPGSQLIHSFLETRDGRYFWIATDNAVYRVARGDIPEVKPTSHASRPGERQLAAVRVSPRSFWRMFETADGRVLGGGAGGMFEVADRDAEQVEFREITYTRIPRSEGRTAVRDFAETSDGELWVATDSGIVRHLPGDRWTTYEVPRVISTGNEAYTVRVDNSGLVWFIMRSGVFILKPERAEELAGLANLSSRALEIKEHELGESGSIDLPDEPGEMIRLRFAEQERPSSRSGAGQAINGFAEDVLQLTDGTIWLPTERGLYVINGENYHHLRDSNGLPGVARRVIEDPQGNIWFGTFSGAVKFTRGGLTSYTAASGLPEPSTFLITETSEGKIVVSHGLWNISVLGGTGFETTQLNLPAIARFRWTSFPMVPDKAGNIWALSHSGLYRFPPQSTISNTVRRAPEYVGDRVPMLRNKSFYRAFNDSQGRIWFSATDLSSQPSQQLLFRYDQSNGEWLDLSVFEGFPKDKLIASFAEDRAGNVWFGFYGATGLVKFDDGKFFEYGEEAGVPGGVNLALLVDSKGRLWVGSNEAGVSRVDEPTAPELRFIRYTENEGLSSNNVRCLTEGADGQIFAGTVRGVTQIDPDNGRMRHISTDDGLAADFVQSAYRDRNGAVWFGTTGGLSKLEPTARTAAAPSPVFITNLQIAGVPYELSGLGQRTVAGIEVDPSDNDLQISYTGVGNALRFQYKLEGANEDDWRPATTKRSVDFANLAPGDYRFLVRAVSLDGALSDMPASISFRINPPVWQRWWFILLAILTVGGAVFALDRYRVSKTRQVEEALTRKLEAEQALKRAREERFKELERVRSRIATDLHDDIGSSLTQIAVLSEVARGQASNINAEQLSMPLERIKTVSRELVAVMSDVVWAINPQKDYLHDLVQRMRRFGSDVFSSRGIAFEFISPEMGNELQLGANIRREVYAIFKETVNNAVKYSECSAAKCEFRIDDNGLTLSISDNGKGFDPAEILNENFKPEMGGNGLVSMHRRAAELGGRLSIESAVGKGATIQLRVPLHRHGNGNNSSSDIHLTLPPE